MKLFKKLLPFATAASSVALVVPFATSCGKSTSNFDYTPDIAPHETKKYASIQEARGEYFAQVKSNPKILEEDLMWSYAQDAKETRAEYMKEYKDVSVSFKAAANFSSISSTSVRHESGDEMVYYLSGKIVDNKKGKITSEDVSDKGIKTKVTYFDEENTTFTLTNVPFVLTYSSDNQWIIYFEIVSDYASVWSVNEKTTIKQWLKIESDKGKQKTDSKGTSDMTYDKDSGGLPNIASFKSYYFQNVTIGQE